MLYGRLIGGKKRKGISKGKKSVVWRAVYAIRARVPTVGIRRAEHLEGNKRALWRVIDSLFAQASTDDSASDGIKFMVPREPGRADGSRLLPRSKDFKDGA